MSYGLYMYQGLYLATGPYRAPDQVWPPDQVVGLHLLLVTAPLFYHLLERPIVGLKHRYQRRVRHEALIWKSIPLHAGSTYSLPRPLLPL
jgi:peptidoglycan/LPS O-acetylase OafA/YrhL